MRGSLLLVAAAVGALLAACQPDVAYSSYRCGANALCPTDMACDGTDGHCVSPDVVQPFACDPADEAKEPDNTAATAQDLAITDCLTSIVSINGCVAPTDVDGDWYKLTVPATCASTVVIHLHISYPLPWEELPFELGDPDGNIMEQSGDCDASETSLAAAGLVDRCLKRTLAPGKTYTIHVFPGDPATTCDGDCTFNRYTLTLQLLGS